MTVCSRLRSRALSLVALPPGDPARETAWAHSLGCPACARALREGLEMIALIDGGLRPSPPPAAALARAEQAVRAQMDRSSARARLLAPVIPLVGFVALVAPSAHRHDAESWAVADSRPRRPPC